MAHRTNELSQDLANAIEGDGAKLHEITEEEAVSRASGGEGWSRKQELGHLVDSCANNRARFIHAALHGEYSGPSYDGDGWVRLGGYTDMPWKDLVDLWTIQNRALTKLIANIPDESLTTECLVGQGPSVTLGFLIEDYILHLQHHLDHLMGREFSSSYPSSSTGY